ncbi:hypothetical protein Bbelb_085200 [Branchiostoma belcheri]|nr:hypothetical protein Bbelb_085200 [Branchiostoma belcheri]
MAVILHAPYGTLVVRVSLVGMLSDFISGCSPNTTLGARHDKTPSLRDNKHVQSTNKTTIATLKVCVGIWRANIGPTADMNDVTCDLRTLLVEEVRRNKLSRDFARTVAEISPPLGWNQTPLRARKPTQTVPGTA